MIILYSTNCPKCKVLEKKLNDANIDFVINSDVEEMTRKGFSSAPMLEIDNKIMDFGQAVQWVNNTKIDDVECASCKI